MSTKTIKFFGFLLCIVLIGWGTARLYYVLTDDFRLSNITYDLSKIQVGSAPHISASEKMKVKAILNQSFSYLGKGAQTYAFQSQDGQYVLKFFKFKHLTPTWFVQLLPPIYPFVNIKLKAAEKKFNKLKNVFYGYELAYNDYRKGSQILYLQLKPTQDFNYTVNVYDKIGIQRAIPLNEVVFLLQRKGETFEARLERDFHNGDVIAAQSAILSILEMYISEYKQGLYDRDHAVMNNTGFINDSPFHLDVGKLSKNDSIKQVEVYQHDLEVVSLKILRWINKHYPQYIHEMETFIASKYMSFTGAALDVKKVPMHKNKVP